MTWPTVVLDSFRAASTHPTDGTAYLGPYNELLQTLFPAASGYTTSLQLKRSPGQNVDFATAWVVKLRQHPIFCVAIKSAATLPHHAKREEADQQMWDLFRALRADLPIPILHGVSAFGTRLCFYRYGETGQRLPSAQPARDRLRFTDAASDDGWNCDVLDDDGAARFCGVVAEVKDMCSQL